MRSNKSVVLFSLAIVAGVAGKSLALAPIADYQVQDTLTSSVGTIGPLTVVGDAADVTFTDNSTVNGHTQSVLTVATISETGNLTDIGGGVQSQTAGFLTSPANYSVVLLADFDLSTALGATKVFDFKNLSADDGLYINDTTGVLEFNEVSNQPLNAPLLITPTAVPPPAAITGTYTQIVLTRNSSDNLVSVYQDGTLDFSFTDTDGLATLGDAPGAITPNADLTVFKDDGTGLGGTLVNETSIGDIARLRIYDGVLSPADIAALDTVAVPEPTTLALLSLATLTLLRRRAGRID